MEKMAQKPMMGKLIKEENSYLLEVDGEHYPVPEGLVAQNPELAKLVGDDVEVMLSEPKPVVVALRKPGSSPTLLATASFDSERSKGGSWCYFINCYIPIDWKLRDIQRIRDGIQKTFANKMLEDGIIPKDTYDQLVK